MNRVDKWQRRPHLNPVVVCSASVYELVAPNVEARRQPALEESIVLAVCMTAHALLRLAALIYKQYCNQRARIPGVLPSSAS